MKMILLCLLFWGLPIRIFAQDSAYHKNSFFIDPLMNVGKSIKIDPDIFPKNDLCWLSELNFGWQTLGRKSWHHIYNFPQIGISLIYAYQGNDVILGRTVGIAPDLSFYLLRTKNNNVAFRIGSGLAYFPVIHDKIENPTNKYIGSHINGIATISFFYERTLSDKLQFKTGVSTFHFSNGHYQLPNAGINSIVFTAGLKYFPSEIKKIPVRKKIEKEKYPLLFNIRMGLGVHDFGVVPYVGNKYMIYSTSVSVSKRIGKISNVQIGVQNKYYTNYYQFITDSNVYKKNKRLKANAFGIFIAHEFICGRLSFLTQGGINLYNPFFAYEDRYLKNNISKYAEIWLCTRIGIQYYFFTPTPERKFNIYTGIFVNANYGRADYDEISMGVSF